MLVSSTIFRFLVLVIGVDVEAYRLWAWSTLLEMADLSCIILVGVARLESRGQH
jgi:hypothetical protein